jgi:hypothetical protein
MRLFSPTYLPWGLAATTLVVVSALLEWGQRTGAVRLASGFRVLPLALILLSVGFVVGGLFALFATEGFGHSR